MTSPDQPISHHCLITVGIVQPQNENSVYDHLLNLMSFQIYITQSKTFHLVKLKEDQEQFQTQNEPWKHQKSV